MFMNDQELKNKILNAYQIEKYAELALLLLFLQEEQNDFRPLAARLVLESDHHKDLIENVLRKMNLEEHLNDKPSISFTRELIERQEYADLLKTLLNNEIIAMNNYIELFLITKKEMVKGYFEDVDEYYRTFKEMSYDELNHAKRILEYIYRVGERLH